MQTWLTERVTKIWVVLLLVLATVMGTGFVFFRSLGQSSPIATPALKANAKIETKKGDNDLSVLEKYCVEEVQKLPEVPFSYELKEGPRISGAMAWVLQFIPEEKRISKHKSCSMAYTFNGRTAYGQMGAEYPMELVEFHKGVNAKLLGKIDPSWKKVSGPLIKEGEMPIVYRRENDQMGTVDYLDAFSGGLVFYVKFNTYYK